jgi:hypothetical protein
MIDEWKRYRFRIRLIPLILFIAYLAGLAVFWPVEFTVVLDPDGSNERWFFNRRESWDPPTEYHWRDVTLGWSLLLAGAAAFAVTCAATGISAMSDEQ